MSPPQRLTVIAFTTTAFYPFTYLFRDLHNCGLVPMMAGESWTGVCVHCAEILANVPPQILLATIAATLLGFLVLVCPIAVSPIESRKPYPY